MMAKGRPQSQSDPLVSVITATYEMGHYLPIAVESVLNQTYPNLEYIVVDDGSTDDTRSVIERYSRDDRLKYHYQRNQGQTRAKNKGLELSSGEYICFLDGDDFWKTDKLARQLEVFANAPADLGVVYSAYTNIDGQGNVITIPEQRYFSGAITTHLLFENFVTFNTAMVRRQCFEQLGGFDETLERSIDYELWLRFSTQFNFLFMPEVTASYRHWEGQMSQDKERRFNVCLEIKRDFLNKHKDMFDKKTLRKIWCETFIVRGRFYGQQKQYGKAAVCFCRSLFLNPLYVNTWRGIGRTVIGWPQPVALTAKEK